MRIISLIATFCFSCSVLALAQQTDGLVELAQNVKVQSATGINTTEREFSPMFYQKGIVFVSSRNKQGPIDEELGETFFDVYFSELDANGMPLKPRPFSIEINSQLHEGPMAFNQKGDRIYFTRSATNPRVNKSGKALTYLQIFEATKGEFDWEKVKPMPFNGNFSCMDPSLSPDGTKLFFASSKPGGFGGTDIYYVEKQGDTWSKPVNMGEEINTEKNEAFPFFHESGALFFTSDGHRGYGGIDIFKIDLTTQPWGKVINIGKPFNSAKDDLGLIINTEGSRGYFSSNRDGGLGKDDIYYFESPDGLPGIEVKSSLNIVVSVNDASNSRRLPAVAIRVFELTGEEVKDKQHLYHTELAPSEQNAADYTFRMVRKKESELGEPRQLTNRTGEAIVPLEENKDYLLLVSKSDYTSQEIKYSTKNMTLPRPVEVLLQPRNCLTINGIVKSTQLDRLIANAKIRVKNECNNQEEIVYTNVNGVFESCLDIGCDYTIISEKKGYAQAFTEISTVKIRGSRSVDIEMRMTPTANEVFSQPLQAGSVIVLENIYYDFNKYAIRPSENQELESLAKLMKQYPSMEIELASYTDSRGESQYNLELSLKRAEAAKKFLMGQQVAGSRIQAFGFGESKLRNQCKDGVECTEEQHAYNRRTEVTITRMTEPTPVLKEYSEKGGKGNEKKQ